MTQVFRAYEIDAKGIGEHRLFPGADAQAHPRATFGGETIVDSKHAVLMYETRHQPIYYFPMSRRADGPAGGDR